MPAAKHFWESQRVIVPSSHDRVVPDIGSSTDLSLLPLSPAGLGQSCGGGRILPPYLLKTRRRLCMRRHPRRTSEHCPHGDALLWNTPLRNEIVVPQQDAIQGARCRNKLGT